MSLSLPLAELIRPSLLQSYIGQEHLVNDENGSIKNFVRMGYLPSMILYGPPGVGKTTLSRILSRETGYVFVEFSATESTMADFKQLLADIVSENRKRSSPIRVVVFMDEIHRLTTTQQDFLLPFIEAGQFVFIGATTVEPKSRIRRAILSRCQLFELRNLLNQDITQVIKKAVLYENIRRKKLHSLRFLLYNDECVSILNRYANSDTRKAINAVELVSTHYTDSSHRDYGTGYDPIQLDADTLKGTIASALSINSGLRDPRNMLLLVKLRELMLQNQELNPHQPAKVRRYPSTRVTTSKKSQHFSVTIKSPALILNSESSDEEEAVVDIKPTSTEYQEWLDHMEFSDTSDVEPSGLYSDDESKLYNMKKISRSRFHIVSAIRCLIQFLENGESPIVIFKQLILFTVCYTSSDNLELRRILSSLTTFQTTNITPLELLSNCVERLMKLPKGDPSFLDYLKLVNEFFSQQALSDFHPQQLFEFIHDEELILKLLSEPKETPTVGSQVSLFDLQQVFPEEFSLGQWECDAL